MKLQSRLDRLSIATLAPAFLLLSAFGCGPEATEAPKEEQAVTQAEAPGDFQISLAQWSLHRTFFGGAIDDWEAFGRTLMEDPDSVLQGADPGDFPAMAAGYGIDTIELVNTFYFTKAEDEAYWSEFKKKSDEAGVTVGLIMCDLLGDLGDADPERRKTAAENHHPWVDVAASLGAHSIRVNAAGEGTPEEVADNAVEGLSMLGEYGASKGTPEEVADAAVDGLSMLGEYGASKGINIIVENHGGYSSDASWLSGVIERVGMDNVGTLPDFGNFCIETGSEGCVNEYDRYKGMAELMPYAKGVSAKSHEFDADGNEVSSDFLRIMKIVRDSGFKGDVGIEYEGGQLSEDEGIKATKALLEKVFAQLSSE